MNILWIFDNPLNPEAGGTERVSFLVMQGLKSRGHTCLGHLVIDQNTGVCNYDGKIVDDLFDFLIFQNINIVINQKAQDCEFLRMFLMLGGQRWKNQGGKIISCLHFNPQPVSEYYDIKVLWPKSFKKMALLLRAKFFPKLVEHRQRMHTKEVIQYIYNNSDIFLLLTETHLSYLKNLLDIDNVNKLQVIPNPLTFQHIIDHNQLQQKKDIAVFVGRMDEYYKRISIILKSWKLLQDDSRFSNWELKIIGDGPCLEAYKKYALDNKLQNVWFEGRCNPEAYYKEAKIFLMTSISEGLPMTILESFQNGVVPIVIDTCPVFHEIVSNGFNGVVCHSDGYRDYAKAIKSIMCDNSKYNELARNAISTASEYSTEHIIDKWQEIITGL